MKNLERFMAISSVAVRIASARAGSLRQLGLGVHRHGLRRHQRAGAHALQAVDDDALAGLQARGHDAQAVDRSAPSVTSRYSALLSAPTTSTNFLFWSVPTARSLTSSAASAARLAHAHARELAGHQRAVACCRTRRARAPCRSWRRPGCRSAAGWPWNGVPLLAGGAHLHRDALDAARARWRRPAGPCSARATTCSSASKLA